MWSAYCWWRDTIEAGVSCFLMLICCPLVRVTQYTTTLIHTDTATSTTVISSATSHPSLIGQSNQTYQSIKAYLSSSVNFYLPPLNWVWHTRWNDMTRLWHKTQSLTVQHTIMFQPCHRVLPNPINYLCTDHLLLTSDTMQYLSLSHCLLHRKL